MTEENMKNKIIARIICIFLAILMVLGTAYTLISFLLTH